MVTVASPVVEAAPEAPAPVEAAPVYLAAEAPKAEAVEAPKAVEAEAPAASTYVRS